MRKFGLRERLGVFSKTTKRTETGRRGFLFRLLAVFGTPALLPRAVYGGPQTAQRTAAISSVPAAAAPADLLLYNGKVITLDAGSRISEAVAIRGSRIIAVGETAALTAQTPPGARRIDLQGSALLPGLFDTHPHMDREGLRSLGGKSLVGANSVAAIVDRVARAARDAQPGEWIIFMPMGEPPFDYVNHPNMLKEGRFPNRHDLDSVAPDNPVYIRNVWGWWSRPPFPAVANSAALRHAGISADTPDPYNIEIVRDRKGNPTGVFLETNRTSLLEYTLFRSVPRFTFADRLESIRRGAKIYSGLGTTSGYEAHGLTPALLRAYREIDEQGELTVRMSAPLSVPSSALNSAQLSELLRQWAPSAGGRGTSSGNFRISGVTLDHANPNVAAPIAREYPYEQWAGKYSQALTNSQFVEFGIEAAKQKLRLHFVIATAPPYHSTESSLDLLEQIDKQAPLRDLRCVAFHLTDATPQQLRRIRELGLVVTLTPSFIYSQAAELGLAKRGQSAVPIREVLDAGIPATLGTDNVPPSMLFTAWAALERWDEVGQRHLGESRLEREEVLRMCCQTPHFMNWEEDRRGKIAPGMEAELVVLDGDPLTCDIGRLPQLSAVLSMVDGQIVHDARVA